MREHQFTNSLKVGHKGAPLTSETLEQLELNNLCIQKELYSE